VPDRRIRPRLLLDAEAALVAALADGRPAPPADLTWIRRHGLAPLAYAHGRAELRADYALSSIRAEQQRAIAREAVAALGEAGIDVILMKGISYAGWLYPDAAERPMSDVDLLVRGPEHERAVDVLASLRYVHAGPAIQRSSRHHAITLKRREAAVDLHRDPAQRGRIAIPLADVWRRSQPAPWIDGARRLDPIDELLFHMVNLARHDLIVPAMSFVDAARMLRRLDDAQRSLLHDRAATWRFGRVLEACIEAVELACGWRSHRGRRWLPTRVELLAGEVPLRAVQLGRKVMLIEGPRELVAYGTSVLSGWIVALTDRNRE